MPMRPLLVPALLFASPSLLVAQAPEPQQIELFPGPIGSGPRGLTVHGGDLYFSAVTTERSGLELHRFDGERAQLVADLTPGPGSTSIDDMVSFGDSLYFTVNRASGAPNDLWKLEGGVAAPVGEGLGVSEAVAMHVFEGHLYFAGEAAGEGTELWRTDGDSFERITDVPGCASFYPEFLGSGGGYLWLRGILDIWRYDGEVLEKAYELRPEWGALPSEPVFAQGTTFFVAHHEDLGRELFAIRDGIAMLEFDLSRGWPSSHPIALTAAGDSLYCTAYDSNSARGLWRLRLDGQGFVRSAARVGPVEFGWRVTEHDGSIYFAGSNGSGVAELWRYDGHRASRVRDLTGFDYPCEFRGDLYFRAEDGERGPELWRIPGSSQVD